MNGRKPIPQRAIEQGLALAKQLVERQLDPAVPAADRLREIGEKLNVSRIEGGAVRFSGFLIKQLDDGSFGVYFASDCGKGRRRFTVAHEFGHLILEKFYRHLSGDLAPGWDGHGFEVEKVVDRIASELLMPQALVSKLMTEHCKNQRDMSDSRTINKWQVLQSVGKRLGVSETAIVIRLLELSDFLPVWVRARWEMTERSVSPRYSVESSHVNYMSVVEGATPDLDLLEQADGWPHALRVQTRQGLRILHCHGWRRRADRTATAHCGDARPIEAWVLGWGWSAFPLLPWDDSDYVGGTPNTYQIRQFENSRKKTKKT